MSKLIAIWGSPHSGKTTLAVKLALELDNRKAGNIMVLHADSITPVMPALFPFEKDIQSVGGALSAVEISQTDILQSAVVPKNRDNIGFAGYAYGDNQFSYPAYDRQKAVEFLNTLKSIAEYVIVDCSSQYSSMLSRAALSVADITVKLAAPDLKAISFFMSQAPLYADILNQSTAIQGLTVTTRDLFQPLEECKRYFENPAFVLPYCPEVSEQWAAGRLTDKIWNKGYQTGIAKVIDQVMNNEN